ncbi:MAG: hypothetical protein ACPG61_07115 [Paracoccaceae bacterium]
MRVETRLIVPDIPADLRQPVVVPVRDVVSLGDVGLVLTDHVEALDRANGQIAAMDCIIGQVEDAAASRAQRPCAGVQ